MDVTPGADDAVGDLDAPALGAHERDAWGVGDVAGGAHGGVDAQEELVGS